jgi:integrase
VSFLKLFIDNFINFRVNLGYCAKTYQYLSDLDKFIDLKYPNDKLLSEKIVIEWSRRRDTEKGTGHSARISNIRLLAKFMVSSGTEAFILPDKVSSRNTDYVPYILSDKELESIFHAADNIKPNPKNLFKHIELSFMLRLTYFCGLRPGECRCLLTSDIDLEEGVLLIRKNKHSKERFVPMSFSVLELCKEYFNKLQQYQPNSVYFFPDPSGQLYTCGWYQKSFKRLWKSIYHDSAALVNPYSLRHRFATANIMNWINKGIDVNTQLIYLSAYMGHSNTNATAYYIHLLPENLVKSSAIDWEHFNSLIPTVRQ